MYFESDPFECLTDYHNQQVELPHYKDEVIRVERSAVYMALVAHTS